MLMSTVNAALMSKRISDAGPTGGECNAKSIRNQIEVIRDVLAAAADCDTWLTLKELRTLTHFGEASISAQIRNLRKAAFGGHKITKRIRPDTYSCGATGRAFSVWEYRLDPASPKCGFDGLR
jgi:hypothetical protein